MPAQQAAQARRNNQAGQADGQPDARNPGGGAGNGEEEALPENATNEQMREYIARLQLKQNNTKHQLNEVTRERDQLLTGQQNKRRRARYVDQPTPDDPKYDKAGKRCALMHQLWVSPDIFEIELDPTYSAERRYEEGEPSMQTQGNLLDVLDSAPLLREDLLQKVHFQSVLINAVKEQRRNSASRSRKQEGSLTFGCPQGELNDHKSRKNNAEFQRLLGYQARADRPQGRRDKRYRSLPPILYKDEITGSNEHLFRHKVLRRLFRACAFRPSSVSENEQPADPRGQRVLAKLLRLKSITPGAIAFSAILARWCLSPDAEFSEKGKTSGIEYKIDYDYYKKLIIEGLRAEQALFTRTATQGPFMRLVNEWNREFFPNRPHADQDDDGEHNSEPSDIEDAMEQIRNYGRGDN